ncbi:uncharacterized protein LOC110985355 [Acanthaster planci]|uniref:Uncharacterized protein LOC110985355 n=1 Tax=Acanthaster planci TaxID=133434 RepID=A0A8B7ZB27_ACAPL|nr:uncharacterized protein LOC110985355 [Acanthaster planci]
MEDALARRGAIYIHASDIQNTLDSGKTLDEQTNQRRVGQRDGFEDIPEDQEAPKTSSRPTLPNARLRRRHAEPKDDPPFDRQTRSATPAKSDETKPTAHAHRRRSISLQGRRPSTVPEFSTNIPQDRRMSVRRNSTLPAPPTQAFVSSMQHTRRASTVPKTHEPDPALTDDQKAAFKEAFDLFDRNGGGTIDADELSEALNSVDIHLSSDEIKEVLQAIDKDGSGEIDFDEFLNIMTNTEKFLEMFASRHEGEGPRKIPAAGRGHILFDALTQFMKSSALKAMDEIVGYYKSKYRRANAPHVVMHYAAGARLIGLTEKQLARHLEKLQASNKGKDLKSPYAQPLRIFLTGAPARTTKKEPAVHPDKERRRCTGKIRLTVHLPPSTDAISLKTDGNEGQSKVVRNSKNTNMHMKPVFQPRLGWVKPHVKSIAARLPQRKSVLTMEDLASIRKRITDATRDHYHDLAKSRAVENQRYWRSLQPQFIPSKTLRSNFRKVFCAYIAAGQRKI